MPLSTFLFDFMQIKICLATTLIRNINALKSKTNMCIFIRVIRPFQANWGQRREKEPTSQSFQCMKLKISLEELLEIPIHKGATRLSTTTFSIVTFSIVTLRIVKISTTRRKCDIQHNHIQHCGIKYLSRMS
jgi:hypothetical protein